MREGARLMVMGHSLVPSTCPIVEIKNVSGQMPGLSECASITLSSNVVRRK